MSKADTIRILPTETYFAMVREKLAKTGRSYVRVTGTSMLPLLRHLKDGVIIARSEKIRPGDIVLFDRLNGRYVLHRVIRVNVESFDMAGDNQWYIERDMPLAQVIGTAVCIVRGDRMISCEKFSLRIHARVVTFLTEPRIKLRRAVGRLVKPFRHAGNRHREADRG